MNNVSSDNHKSPEEINSSKTGERLNRIGSSKLTSSKFAGTMILQDNDPRIKIDNNSYDYKSLIEEKEY